MNDKHTILEQISEQLDTLNDFNQLQIHIKKHVGAFSNTDYVKLTPYRYSDNEPNVNCTADILKLIKNVADAELTGHLSFGVTFKKGRAQIMQVQDFKKL